MKPPAQRSTPGVMYLPSLYWWARGHSKDPRIVHLFSISSSFRENDQSIRLPSPVGLVPPFGKHSEHRRLDLCTNAEHITLVLEILVCLKSSKTYKQTVTKMNEHTVLTKTSRFASFPNPVAECHIDASLHFAY